MLLLMSVGLFVLTLPWNPLAFAALCTMAGVVMAPALIMQSMLVAKTARPDQSTEAFTWSSSALLGGIGLGFAVGGGLLEYFPAPAAFAASASAALAAAALARLTIGRASD
jgi:predicted MFS family arabinose efflux permease